MVMVHARAGLLSALVLLFGHTSHTEASTSGVEDTPASSFFESDGPVAELTRETFISAVLESRSPAAVWFFSASNCPQCEEISEIFESSAKKLTAWGITVGAVNMDEERKLAKDLRLPKKFPPMLNVYHGPSTSNPYGGLPVRSYDQVPYAKDARGLQKQILNLVPDNMLSVNLNDTGDPLKEALAAGDGTYAAVLVTASGKTSPLMRVLANAVSGVVDGVQGHVPDKVDGDDASEETHRLAALQRERERVTRLLSGAMGLVGGVRSVPALILWDKAARTSVLYEGDVNNAQAMLEFIQKNAKMPVSSFSSSSSSSSTADGEGASPIDEDEGLAPPGGVLALDPARLSTLLEQGVEALVVAFVETPLVEGGMEAAIPGWEKTTKGLQGQIRAAVVDCTAYPSESHCTAKRPPHIKVYPHGEGLEGSTRAHPSAFSASQLKEAVADAESSLPEVVIVIPKGTSAQQATEVMQGVVANSILGEGNPMVLIVLSKREEPNLMVKTVAAQFKPAGVKTLFISHPDPEVMAGLQMPRVPAMILMFQAPDDAPELEGRPVDPSEKAMITAPYSPGQWGAPSHKTVSEFIVSHLSHTSEGMFLVALNSMSRTAELNGESLSPQLQRMSAQFGTAEGASSSSSSAEGQGSQPATEIPFTGVQELTVDTWASLSDASAKGGKGVPRVVGVFFLDRYADGFDLALKAAESAAQSAHASKGGSGAFVWVDAPCQEGFAKALGVSDLSALPVLATFSPKHNKSGRFVGAWESGSLSSFLKQALGGRAPMFSLEQDARIEAVDCSQRPGPDTGNSDDAGVADDGMDDLMAEILAEEAKAKRELEEEVARGLEEIKEAEALAAAAETAKPKTKTVKRKKKKKSSAGGSSGEL